MFISPSSTIFFFFNDTATTEIYTLSLHDALPIRRLPRWWRRIGPAPRLLRPPRSEEHTSELQSPYDLVCRLLLEKKKKKQVKLDLEEKNKVQNIKQKNIIHK